MSRGRPDCRHPEDRICGHEEGMGLAPGFGYVVYACEIPKLCQTRSHGKGGAIAKRL